MITKRLINEFICEKYTSVEDALYLTNSPIYRQKDYGQFIHNHKEKNSSDLYDLTEIAEYILHCDFDTYCKITDHHQYQSKLTKTNSSRFELFTYHRNGLHNEIGYGVVKGTSTRLYPVAQVTCNGKLAYSHFQRKYYNLMANNLQVEQAFNYDDLVIIEPIFEGTKEQLQKVINRLETQHHKLT